MTDFFHVLKKNKKNKKHQLTKGPILTKTLIQSSLYEGYNRSKHLSLSADEDGVNVGRKRRKGIVEL